MNSVRCPQNAKYVKFEQQSATTLKRYEIGCQLVLITNRKSHTGFQLIRTSMTLKGVIALILRILYRIRLLCWPITSQWLEVDQ